MRLKCKGALLRGAEQTQMYVGWCVGLQIYLLLHLEFLVASLSHIITLPTVRSCPRSFYAPPLMSIRLKQYLCPACSTFYEFHKQFTRFFLKLLFALASMHQIKLRRIQAA